MFEQSNEQNNTNIPAQLQLLQHFICNNQLQEKRRLQIALYGFYRYATIFW